MNTAVLSAAIWKSSSFGPRREFRNASARGVRLQCDGSCNFVNRTAITGRLAVHLEEHLTGLKIAGKQASRFKISRTMQKML
jgi:hypothetical protein